MAIWQKYTEYRTVDLRCQNERAWTDRRLGSAMKSAEALELEVKKPEKGALVPYLATTGPWGFADTRTARQPGRRSICT